MERVPSRDQIEFVLEEASRCLYCGFCEALCPTRPLGPHRGFGPRGRVNIALAVARGEASFTPAVVESLYTCLLCGACELKCPARIRIVDIVRASRSIYASQRDGSRGRECASREETVSVGVSRVA